MARSRHAQQPAQAHSKVSKHDLHIHSWQVFRIQAPAMACNAKSSAKQGRHFEALLLEDAGAISIPCQLGSG